MRDREKQEPQRSAKKHNDSQEHGAKTKEKGENNK
jgi:hypothetical protein